ncbi:MAG: YIP1 family protein [Acidobacteria bacterium]|nr:YIP1 family protein [Acidobacteriota bacterium]
MTFKRSRVAAATMPTLLIILAIVVGLAAFSIGAAFGPFFNVIVAPKECWAALDVKPMLSIWIMVWIAVFSTGMAIYNMPITQRVLVESARASLRAQGSEMTAEQLQGAQEIMMMIGAFLAYLSSIMLLVMIAGTALVIWVLGAIMGGTGVTFGRAFGVAAAAGVIRPFLYSIYATVILNMNPPVIRRPEDATTMAPTLGLDLVLSGPDTPVWLHAFFARVDLFLLWYAVLIVTGCVGVMKLSKGQGITVATILWLFGTVFAVGFAWLQTSAGG